MCDEWEYHDIADTGPPAVFNIEFIGSTAIIY